MNSRLLSQSELPVVSDHDTRAPALPVGRHVLNLHRLVAEPALPRWATYSPRSLAEHAHSYFQIAVFLRNARARYRLQGGGGRTKFVDLQGADVLVIPPGQPHAFELARAGGMVNWYVDTPTLQVLNPAVFEWLGRRVNEASVVRAEPLLRLARRMHEQTPSRGLAAGAWEAAWELAVDGLCPSANRIRCTEATARRRVAPALELIEAGLDQPLKLDDMAQACGLAPSLFRKLFVKAHGLPPMRYLQLQRLALAQTLLISRSISVARVGARCGYNDAAHFAALFREVTGLTPTAFRAALHARGRPTHSRAT